MERLKSIIDNCRCGVSIDVNAHRNYYQSAEDYLNDAGIIEESGDDAYKRMIELDTIIEIQFYPRTPIGFYTVYHYDIDKALDEVITIINELKD